MSLPVKLSKRAKQDILDIGEYYTKEHNVPYVAEMFVDFVSEACNRLEAFPDAWVERNGYRRILMDKFPYSIYYKITSKKISVLRVFHNSRRPDSWR